MVVVVVLVVVVVVVVGVVVVVVVVGDEVVVVEVVDEVVGGVVSTPKSCKARSHLFGGSAFVKMSAAWNGGRSCDG